METSAVTGSSSARKRSELPAPRWLTRVVPQRQRAVLRQIEQLLRRHPRDLRSIVKQVAIGSLQDVLLCYSDFNERPEEFTDIRLHGHSQPARLRNRTSDFAVFREVILRHQYLFPTLQDVRFIIDAGANIGLTSLYLLRRYPQAQVIAIEPDPENYEIAAHNLAPFTDRCHLVNAGLWHENTTLGISRGSFRDGRHWATQTVPANTSQTDSIPAYTLQTLLDKFNFPHIDLLKIDIEGAELQVFRDGDTSFLARTGCCAVECHDEDCEAAYRAALAPHRFNLSTQSELLVARK